MAKQATECGLENFHLISLPIWKGLVAGPRHQKLLWAFDAKEISRIVLAVANDLYQSR